MTTDYSGLVAVLILSAMLLVLVFWLTRVGGPFDTPARPPRWPWLSRIWDVVTTVAMVVTFVVTGIGLVRNVAIAHRSAQSVMPEVAGLAAGVLGCLVFVLLPALWREPAWFPRWLSAACFYGAIFLAIGWYELVDRYFGTQGVSAMLFAGLASFGLFWFVASWRERLRLATQA